MEDDIYIAFFEASDIAGKVISKFEKFFFPNKKKIYTHVGIIIKTILIKDIIPCYQNCRYVILESTMSGSLNDNVKNTCRETFLGVQLRDFDELISIYKRDKKKISISSIKKLPHDYISIIRRFITHYINKNFDVTIVNLITIHTPLPSINTSGLFCSDLVCKLLQEFSIINVNINSKKVSPNTLYELVKDSISYPMYISY
jgi:hypothetical protein